MCMAGSAAEPHYSYVRIHCAKKKGKKDRPLKLTGAVLVRYALAYDHLSGCVALPHVVRTHGGERVDRILIGDNSRLRGLK